MRSWQYRLIPAITAILMLLGTGAAAHAVSDEEAVLIPGGIAFKQINPLSWLLIDYYPNIGINFHDDDNPEVIDYSQDVLAIDSAIRDGVVRAEVAVRAVDGRVVIIGESLGSLVASRLAARLANTPDPPAIEDIRVVLIAPPEAGIGELFKVGTFVPMLNYRISRVPESPYPTTMVIGEYDGVADPPDRPWNLVSLFNAALGTVFVHDKTTALSDPADVPPENITIERNSLGATVTTYLVPAKNLPLTQPLRLAGLPDDLVDRVDQVLRPIIDAGYRRHDQPGDPRPYLSEGQIRRDVRWQPEMADRRIERAEPRQLRSAIHAQRRQQTEAALNDRVVQRNQKKADRSELRIATRVERRQPIAADVQERVVQRKRKGPSGVRLDRSDDHRAGVARAAARRA